LSMLRLDYSFVEAKKFAEKNGVAQADERI
jgi:hypothetical protein